jgi:tetratricopeptide (TPR) repeat protein
MKNKHTILLILFLLSEILFGQKINKNLDNAKKAIAAKEYTKAIKLYEKLISKDRYNDSLQLDLANLYFLTNKVQKACDCVNLIDRVNNKIADTLVEKCKNYPIKVKYLKDVDAPPMVCIKTNIIILL